jgi:pyruvate-formate lyase-activating enzyme
MIKVREFQDCNYKAIFHNHKTLRMALDPTKPITELDYPEFYDVAINDKCNAMCSWCYVSALKSGTNFNGVHEKIEEFFGSMSENEKPFQVAIGGAGEPTMHPEFTSILKKFYDTGIVPNYTTNGMHLTDEIIEATKQYSGGVALSCHPHLDKYWESAANRYIEEGIRTNMHVIISDEASIERFFEIYEKYSGKVEYFVLLPYTVQGRAKETELHFDELFRKLKEMSDVKDIAFGANFYPYLISHDISWLDISLYEPEIMSKYLVMNDDMAMYNSSFSEERIN